MLTIVNGTDSRFCLIFTHIKWIIFVFSPKKIKKTIAIDRKIWYKKVYIFGSRYTITGQTCFSRKKSRLL